MEKVYSVLVKHFKRWGVTHVFGIPGKSISPLVLEIEAVGIEYVLGRHESGCGYEASGYALVKKSIGVAIATSGPGGTNLLTSVAQAKENNLPVLFVTGHPSATETGRALSQESSQFGTDLVKIFEPVTKFSARVDRPEILPRFLRHAIEKACTGEKGPVHLCIPFDVLTDEIEDFYIPLPDHVAPMASTAIERVVNILNEARKPVIFLGKGAVLAEVFDEVRMIAEHWHIPVITAPGGKGAFLTNHPLNKGGFGLGGAKDAIEYFRSGVDVMVVIGSSLCDMQLSGFTEDMYPERVIQFDYSLTFVGKSIPVPTDPILGDIKYNVREVVKLVGIAPDTFESTYDVHREVAVSSESLSLTSQKSDMLSARSAFRSLRAALPDDAILFGDAGSHSFYAVQHFDIREPGTFYLDEVFISMGAAIGYAIGAKIANPQRPIVSVTGDGCMMMYGTELSTAVNHDVSVIFFVFNNARLDMVDKGMSYNTGRSVGAVYKTPLDVSQFARSMGLSTYRCRTEADISDAIVEALTANGPTVVEVMVDPEEIPPILTRLLSLD